MLWMSYLAKRRGLSLPEPTVSDSGYGVPRDVRTLLEDFGREDKTYRALNATAWSPGERLDPIWKEERLQMARILIDSRDTHSPQDKSLISVLFNFIAHENTYLTELVLEKGVGPNATGRGGIYAIPAACGNPRAPSHITKAVIELLVKYGATIHGQGQYTGDSIPLFRHFADII